MYIILLRLSTNRDRVKDLFTAHKAWLDKGFEDGVFLLGGRLDPDVGGGILARSESPEEIEARVNQDPFVAHGVVTPEILHMTPSLANDRLSFLLAPENA